MKLKQTRARLKTNLKPSSTDIDESEGSEAGIKYEDENIFFEEINPFSPAPRQLRDHEYEDWLDDQISNHSKISDNLSDVSWEDEERKGSKKRLKRDGKSGKTPKKRSMRIRKLVKEDALYDIAITDVVKDETMIDSVRNILNLFPNQFSKAYCRYVFEEQIKDRSEKVLKTSRCKWRLYLASNSSNKCIICEKKEFSRTHLKEHKGPEGFKCVCGKTSKTLNLFYEHITGLHAGECYCCPYCNSKYVSAEQIEQHLKTDHHQEHRYICAVCKKGSNRETEFLEHINTHTGLRPHQCNKCDKNYCTLGDLREHQTRHHNKNVQLVCPVCGKQFVSQKLLNTHAVIHGEIRKHICNICGKSYKTRQTLVCHQSYHSSGKHFTCSDCGNSYSVRASLKRHLRRKKHGSYSEKIEKSESVKVMTKQASAPKRKCASDKRFPCSDCDRSYSRKKGLTAHWKAKKHGPHSERISNESDHESTAFVENCEPRISESTPEITRPFNTVALSDEVKMFEFDSCEVNKQPLLLEKRLVVDDMEIDSDEENGLLICL